MTRSRQAGRWAAETLMIVLALLFLFPILFLLMMTFKEPRIFYQPFQFPRGLYLAYYRQAFTQMAFLRGLFNSTVVTAGGLLLTIAVSSMAGYILTRMSRRFFRISYFYFLTGMVIPAVVSLIPLFRLSIWLHLINTRMFMVLLYTASFIPFATFLFAAFAKSIPREMEESAGMDGCGRWRTFWRIIFPLLVPATGTFVVTNVYSIWNDFLTPLIFLNTPEKMTLMPQIVQFMFNKQSVNYGPVFAVCVLAVLPLIVLFLVTQKFMLRGLMAGALKG